LERRRHRPAKASLLERVGLAFTSGQTVRRNWLGVSSGIDSRAAAASRAVREHVGMSSATDRRQRGLHALLLVGFACLFISGCGEMYTAPGNVALRRPAPKVIATELTGAHLAHAIGETLLDTIEVPNGAERMAHAPPASQLNHAPQREATPNLVDVDRIWRIGGKPLAHLTALERSHPPGLHVTGGGGGIEGPGIAEKVRYVTFRAEPPPGVQSETLIVTEATAPRREALLRADAQVVWTSPRPSTERIPHKVSYIVVLRRSPAAELLSRVRRAGHPLARPPKHGVTTLRRVIRQPAAVRRIIAAVEGLPIVQPGAIVCPAEPFGPVVYLGFHAGSTRLLAVAVQSAGDEIGNCAPMELRIGGRQEAPLGEGERALDVVDEILSAQLLPGLRR
jgi:hypothetical protein